ncbi:MAG: integrase, partial [Pelagibacterium sp.]|nr:integrase [Pelagibacterium sp.]
MAKQTHRLTARSVTTITKPGLHADGDGLYLVVDKTGAKRWAFIFQWDGKRKEMGLGNLASIGLADARGMAADARRLLATGKNPIEERKRAKAEREAAAMTFGKYAEEFVGDITKGFHNDKHQAQWRMTLSVVRDQDDELVDSGYCLPIRNKRLDEITTEDILGILKPIWETKNETASRTRGRIERVLDAAKAKGYRTGENPARWRGHLQLLLSKRKKLSRGHHAALPFDSLSDFMPKLRAKTNMGAKALRFAILTASRSVEVRFATWREIDLAAKLWTVPKERMKSKERDHRVPLTDEAMALLEELKETATSEWVFPGQRPGRPISQTALEKAAKSIGGKITVHGFRSTFRDWVEEETAFPDKLAEA